MCRRCGCLTRADTREPVHPVVIEGFLEPALLLLLREQESYGYQLAQWLVQRGLASQPVSPARVYEALRRLVGEGAVRRQPEPGEQGPSRFRYALTGVGEIRLKRWAEALRTTEASLHTFFIRYQASRLTLMPLKEEHAMGCQCQCCGGSERQTDRDQAEQSRESSETRRKRELEDRIEELETALAEVRAELSQG